MVEKCCLKKRRNELLKKKAEKDIKVFVTRIDLPLSSFASAFSLHPHLPQQPALSIGC